MLVKDYVDQIVQLRPYKYSTRQTLIKDVKRMGIWDLDINEVTSSLITHKISHILLETRKFSDDTNPFGFMIKSEC